MDQSINQRIKEIADKLCDENVSELARTIGVKQPSLRDVIGTRQVSPRSEVLTKIVACQSLHINADWLLTGKGPMQKDGADIIYHPNYRDVGRKPIPIYDINAAANLQTLLVNENQNVMGEISVPNAPDCDGAIYVRGDSMYPLIKSGDMVAFKQVRNIDNLIAGEMYVVDCQIDGDDYLVVKYVKWEEKHATLRLISYNTHYQDMVIPVEGVRSIALIKMAVSVNSMV